MNENEINEEFYLIQYVGLYLQMNSTGHVFTHETNSANRFPNQQSALDWIQTEETLKNYAYLTSVFNLLKCTYDEKVEGNWIFEHISLPSGIFNLYVKMNREA